MLPEPPRLALRAGCCDAWTAWLEAFGTHKGRGAPEASAIYDVLTDEGSTVPSSLLKVNVTVPVAAP
jgi:hypothetical protein